MALLHLPDRSSRGKDTVRLVWESFQHRWHGLAPDDGLDQRLRPYIRANPSLRRVWEAHAGQIS